VRVVAHDLGGAARERPVDRRVDLAEQQRAPLLVRLAGRTSLRPVDDPGHALHVKGNKDLHRSIIPKVITNLIGSVPWQSAA